MGDLPQINLNGESSGEGQCMYCPRPGSMCNGTRPTTARICPCYKAPSTAEQWVVQGRPGSSCTEGDGCSTRLVNVEEPHALRCCADSKLDAQFMKNGSCSVWHNTFYGRVTGTGNHSGCTVGKVSFKEGWEFCLSKGARMCTKTEVEEGCVAGSGCGADTQTVWAVPNAEDASVKDFCNFFNANENACKANVGCSFDVETWVCSSTHGTDFCNLFNSNESACDANAECTYDASADRCFTEPDVDCVMEWSACSADCERTSSVKVPSSGTGKPCMEAMPACAEGEDACPAARTCTDLMEKYWPTNVKNWWKASSNHWQVSTDNGVVEPRWISGPEDCRAWCLSEAECTSSFFRGSGNHCTLYRDGQNYWDNQFGDSTSSYCS